MDITLTLIQSKIYEVRGQKVMLDFDLAEMYQVETRILNQSVKRNQSRFPEDFMFQLTNEEWEDMSSQFVMTSRAKRPKSALPLAFTEHGKCFFIQKADYRNLAAFQDKLRFRQKSNSRLCRSCEKSSPSR